jgi:hypothetical protein
MIESIAAVEAGKSGPAPGRRKREARIPGASRWMTRAAADW